MAKIIAVANQKGGVGKTTTAVALADGLSRRGYSTLLVDLDPQGNASLAANAAPEGPTIYDVLLRKANAQEAVQEHTQHLAQEATRADILPSSPHLAGLDIDLSQTGKEYRLREEMRPLGDTYDFIILDTPPALGILTVNALTAADCIIIPAQADIFSLQGISQLTETVSAVREYTNKNLEYAGILLVRHNKRTIIGRDLAEIARETAEGIGTFLYSTIIRETVVIKEAQINQQSLYEYAPNSNGAADYEAFVNEFIDWSGQHGE